MKHTHNSITRHTQFFHQKNKKYLLRQKIVLRKNVYTFFKICLAFFFFLIFIKMIVNF